MLRCEWQNARERSDVGVRQMQESKKISAEMEQGQKELARPPPARMNDVPRGGGPERVSRARAQPACGELQIARFCVVDRPCFTRGLSSS